MLRTDLIELVNGGDVWALIGSGPSIDAGGPSWRTLVVETTSHLESMGVSTSEDGQLRKAIDGADYLRAFSRLVAISDRGTVDNFVRSRTGSVAPGRIARSIADWPFAGIITTNYDSSIETALQGVGAGGWVPVGNSASELPKVTGGASKIIWHIHGATALPDRSRLIMTQEDYDDIYLHSSKLNETLAGLLTHRRLVVIGFGFNDPEVNRLVRRIGSLCSPERPVFAFLGGLDGAKGQTSREEFRDYFNVEVIPYRLLNGGHEELRQLVDVHGALMIRNSLRLNQPQRSAPSWDAETAALLTYNELVLRHGAGVPDDVLLRILRARIVARLKYESRLSREDIAEELTERARLLTGTGHNLPSVGQGSDAVDAAIDGLVNDGLLDDLGSTFELTESGKELVLAQFGKAELLREQFSASLRDRTLELGSHPSTIDRITRVVSEYFEECMTKRGLGVALAWQGATQESRRFQMTALLQHLPEHLSQLTTTEEAEVAIRVVEDVLTRPSQGEKVYLGVRTQAEFSVHLLAYSPELVASRVREIAETAFLLDSNVLIPLLAVGVQGHGAAVRMTTDLTQLGALVTTTEDFVQEVRDHATWARKLFAKGGPQSTDVLAAAAGRAGFRENLFLAGFVRQVDDAGIALDFDRYLDDICSSRSAHKGHLGAYVEAFERLGVKVQSLGKWDGFEPLLWDEREDASADIELARKERNTYRSVRQVNAEAEARVLVDSIRSGELGLEGRSLKQAFFVSNSRVVDHIGGLGERVTMRAESVMQWVSTLCGAPPEELSCLVDGLLGEMAEDGFAIVDRKSLVRVFAPMIDASLDSLSEQLGHYEILISEEYGEDARLAFNDRLDAPIVERALLTQRAVTAEAAAERERIAIEDAEKRAAMTERDEADLVRLRARAEERRKRGVRKTRAAQSRSGRGRRK